MAERPNMHCLEILQKYSTRAWVYRLEEGWIFAELTPDELAEFKSYGPEITIPRMRVRLPYSHVTRIRRDLPGNLANWFAYCTMPQVPPLLQVGFQIHHMTDKPKGYTRYPVEPGSYEAWLWADEVKFCREVGCDITVHHGWCWREWVVPAEWRPPLPPYKERVIRERVFIYTFVNELAQEVYVGQTENVERRRAEHLRDTKNADKVALLQSLRAQESDPKPIILEEVAGVNATEREYYWICYYKSKGYKITNHDLFL